MNSSRLLVVVVVLQSLTLLGQWTGAGPSVQSASAQVPDAGAQRLQMIAQLEGLNGKMDKLVGLLGDGNLQVRVVKDDDKK